MFSWRCFPFVESAPRAYRLKASNAAPLSSTSAGTFPLSAAGDKTIAVVGRNIGKGGVNAAVDSYLSTSHRDSPSPICPFAALGSEMARAGEEAKAAATEVLERLFATLAGGASGAEARGQAIVGLSTMIGAMTLARIVAVHPLSEEILNRAKDHLHR